MAVIQNLKQSINGKVEAIMLKDVRKKCLNKSLEQYYRKIDKNHKRKQKSFKKVDTKEVFIKKIS